MSCTNFLLPNRNLQTKLGSRPVNFKLLPCKKISSVLRRLSAMVNGCLTLGNPGPKPPPAPPPVISALYPPLVGATDVWLWGEANGPNYVSEIKNDVYVGGGLGDGDSGDIIYGGAGPVDMKSIFWQNDAGNNSHHTAPGITAGQSSGPVNAAMPMGASPFQLFFGINNPVGNPDSFYNIFDYDLQESPSIFNAGIQIFVSTAGIFAPASLVVLVFDDLGGFGEWKHTFTTAEMFEDALWHQIKLSFDVDNDIVPTFRHNGIDKVMTKVFGSDLNALSSITPVNGIRFAQREYSEAAAGRAHLKISAAAYAKNLTYDWPYWI